MGSAVPGGRELLWSNRPVPLPGRADHFVRRFLAPSGPTHWEASEIRKSYASSLNLPAMCAWNELLSAFRD